jgi:DNA-binding XRE family transcriptional regulator
MSNPLETLLHKVQDSFPQARCHLDAAENPAGSWFLDINLADYLLVVEWRPDGGFGLTAGRDGVYGEGVDETWPDLGSAQRRVLWLLEHRTPTAPPLADQLRRMRVKRHLTQEELARRLGVKQSSVSKLEGRGETVSIRKLQELLAGMGGQLTLRVSFPDSGEVEELSLGELRTGTQG